MNKKLIVKMIFIDVILSILSVAIYMWGFNKIYPEKMEDKTVLDKETTSDNSIQDESGFNSIGKFGVFDKEDNPLDNENTSSVQSNDKTSGLLDKKREEIENYKSKTSKIKIEKVEYGYSATKVVYYVADVYVKNINYLKTAFAYGSYGKNIKDDALNIAKDNSAIFAVTGDFYGNSENGVVIRNGIVYRENNVSADIGVLYCDGTFATYSADGYNSKLVNAKKPWQAWTFGPSLLDDKGNVLTTFNSNSFINKNHPRSAFGYVNPGHYVFVVVDGRGCSGSVGVTLSQLAEIMKDEGCKKAYNFDGGRSSQMIFNGKYINVQEGSRREISDIVFIPKK